MTDKQYNALVQQLESNGYRKWPNERGNYLNSNCDWYYSKTIRDDDGESLYIVNWLIYDFHQYTNRDAWLKEHPWGIEIIIYVFQGVELHLCYRKYTIEEVESVAKNFFGFSIKHELNKDSNEKEP